MTCNLQWSLFNSDEVSRPVRIVHAVGFGYCLVEAGIKGVVGFGVVGSFGVVDKIMYWHEEIKIYKTTKKLGQNIWPSLIWNKRLL